jgi:sialic acid synthase SpsE
MTIEIIAELAQGFEGKPEQAKLLLKAAASAGANAAKFQLVNAEELATPDYKHFDLFKSLEMSDEIWIELSNLAMELDINLQVDIFGPQSLELAEKINVSAIKMHGTDITNVSLLKKVAKSPVKKVLLGAGGALLTEIEKALEIINNKQVTVLLGFQGYPTHNEDNQISRVRFLSNLFKRNYSFASIGFADHAPSNNPLSFMLAAVALGAGATVIEKHLTLGQIMKLEDHESALNPDQFFEFTNTLRSCWDAIGKTANSNNFEMSLSEKNYRKMIRRHVVSNADLNSGHRILPEDLELKRTSSKEFVTELTQIYNKILKDKITKNKPIKLSDLE